MQVAEIKEKIDVFRQAICDINELILEHRKRLFTSDVLENANVRKTIERLSSLKEEVAFGIERLIAILDSKLCREIPL